MARKAKVVAESKDPSTGPSVDDEGFYCVKGELLWKYRAHQAEFDALQHRIVDNKRQIRTMIDSNPELRQLFEEQNELVRSNSLALTELSEVNSQIERNLGVSLKNCGIDDKTGRVHELQPDGTTTPLAPKKRKAATRSTKTK